MIKTMVVYEIRNGAGNVTRYNDSKAAAREVSERLEVFEDRITFDVIYYDKFGNELDRVNVL